MALEAVENQLNDCSVPLSAMLLNIVSVCNTEKKLQFAN